MALAFVFSTRSTGWGYATRMCARQPSHPGLARTAGTSPVATSAGGLDAEQSCDFFQSGTEDMARAMVRHAVNARTASILYTARRVLERRRVFLVCDGISPQMAADLGFAYCTNDFDDALAVALAERGRMRRLRSTWSPALMRIHPEGRSPGG